MATWSLVREALRQAPAENRRTITWLVVASATVLVLQVWDVRNASGAAGTAELLSVAASVGGVLILAITTVLGAGGAVMSQSRQEPDATLTLKDGRTVHVSRRRAADVRRAIGG